jgi:hypothetical protein
LRHPRERAESDRPQALRWIELRSMKGRHAAALALVAWLMMPLPLRAASGPIAVSGTADVQKSWYLMSPFPNETSTI